MSRRRRSTSKLASTNPAAEKDMVRRAQSENKRAIKNSVARKWWSAGGSAAIILLSTLISLWDLQDPANAPRVTVLLTLSCILATLWPTMITSLISEPASESQNSIDVQWGNWYKRLLALLRTSRWSQASLSLVCVIVISGVIIGIKQPWPHYEPVAVTGYTGVPQSTLTNLVELTHHGNGTCTRIGSDYRITMSMQEANSIETCDVSPEFDFDSFAIELRLTAMLPGDTASEPGLGAAGLRIVSDKHAGDFYQVAMSSQNGFQVNAQVGLVLQEKQSQLPVDFATLQGSVTHDVVLVSTQGAVGVWVDGKEQPKLRVDDVSIGRSHLSFYAQVGPQGATGQLDGIISSIKVWTI